MGLDDCREKLCTNILHWGKYQYQGLHMGVSIAPDVFQEKISMLFQDMIHVKNNNKRKWK